MSIKSSLTLVGKMYANKCTWEVGEQLSHSDHLPIMTTLKARVTHQSVSGREPNWRRHGADWPSFRQELEDKMSDLEDIPNVSKRLERFNNLVLEAARKHVGKSKPRRNGKPCITPDVKEAIKKRNQLRKKVSEHREDWLQACREVKEKIREAKEES